MNATYICTDLASECRDDWGVGAISGVNYLGKQKGKVHLARIEVENAEGEKTLGKPVGTYLTLTFPDLRYLDNDSLDTLHQMLCDELISMMQTLAPEAKTVLVVGLGNRRITSDAVGPQTAEKILVTRHLSALEPALFKALGRRSVAVLCPGVLADTGVEAAELVKKAVETVCPDLVIAVDALAARRVDRLGCTVQLSDSGIAPGSGVGNCRMALSKETLGVPVLALGVPTVVGSATIVYDALEKANMAEPNEQLRRVLEDQRRFFVTPKESDEMVKAFGDLLSHALDAALALPKEAG